MGGGFIQLLTELTKFIQRELLPKCLNYMAVTPAIASRPEESFMFFHDAPTYQGMSCGPLFNTPSTPGNDTEINIFGIVQGYNSPDPDDNPANNIFQSRCGASFIKSDLLY